MIIQHTTDFQQVLFNPEDLKERKALDSFPGLLRQGLQFYCPNKQHVVYNLYQRLAKKIKVFKFSPSVKKMIDGDFIIKDIPEWFKFHTQPLKHQLIALRFAYTFGSFLNLSEPGLGKTKVTLDYIWLLQAQKSLIVCPKSLRFVWEVETLKHRPELSVYVVQTTDWSKEIDAINKADIVVINYDKAVTLEEPLRGLKFDFVAVDEGLIKNPATERTKALTRLSKGIKYRCVMSGTLVNNSPLDVFAPLRFIEPALVGESFSKFQTEYAVFTQMKGGTMRFVTGYRKTDEVKEMLASCGVIMTKKEWLTSLPPKEFIHKYVQMGDVQRDYYQKLASNYLLQLDELGVEIEVDNPLSVLIKLNQISNGFVYYKENTEETLNDLYGTEGRKRSKEIRKTYFFEDQPKAKALIRLITSEEFNNPGPNPTGNMGHGSGNLPTGGSGNVLGTECGASVSGGGESSDSGFETCGGYSVPSRGEGGGSDVHCSITESRREPDQQIPSESERSSYNGGVPSGQRDDSGSDESRGRSTQTALGNADESTIQLCVDDGEQGGLSRDGSRSEVPNTGEHNKPDDPTIARRSIPGPKGTTSDTSLPAGRRAIIWYNLAAERDIIEKYLTAARISFLVIAGGSKDIGGIVKRFNEDPSIQFLLCQAKTINYGVTIMGTAEEDLADDVFPEFDPLVSDEIFYSMNFSLEVFLQQQDRIHRIGQVRKCRYWMILTNSKIERRIAERLEEKLVCNKQILVDIMETLEAEMLES